jgi:hypothetical protein
MSFWLVVALICGHYLGDFFLQTPVIARNKASSMYYLIIHGIIIFASLLFMVTIFEIFLDIGLCGTNSTSSSVRSILNVLAIFVYSVLHCIQDKYIWTFFNSRKKVMYSEEWEKGFFRTLATDQLLHMIILFSIFKIIY